MTQRDQILAHLQAGHTITPLQALSLFGCFALSQRIGELKRQGYPIVSTLVREGRKSYARYAMAGQIELPCCQVSAGVNYNAAAYPD